MASLSEDAGVDAPNGAFNGEIVTQGAAQAPFSMFLGDSSNWKTPAGAFLSTSLGKVLKSKGVDYQAQEDARQLSWQGNGRGLLSIQTQRHTDLTAFGGVSELSLSLHYRLDEAPSEQVFWAVGCGDNCGAKLDITEQLSRSSLGEWQKLAVPLQCFTKAGLNPPISKRTSFARNQWFAKIKFNAIVGKEIKGVCPLISQK